MCGKAARIFWERNVDPSDRKLFHFVCFEPLFGETRSRSPECLKRKCAVVEDIDTMEDIQGKSNTAVLLVSSTVLGKKVRGGESSPARCWRHCCSRNLHLSHQAGKTLSSPGQAVGRSSHTSADIKGGALKSVFVTGPHAWTFVTSLLISRQRRPACSAFQDGETLKNLQQRRGCCGPKSRLKC